MMFVVRKSLTEEEYLDRDGNWGPFPNAKQFGSEDAAEKFMKIHNASDGDILTYWQAKELWEDRMDFWCGEDEKQPTGRIFVATPTRDGDLYKVCSTDDRDGALSFIYGQGNYEVVEEVPSMAEALAYCGVHYGIDSVESV